MDFSSFGPILIARNLVEDGFGILSRAWERDSNGEIQSIFLRRFPPQLCVPAVAKALARAVDSRDLPAACGTDHQFGLQPAPHWKLRHQNSRSIRRIQEQCREEGFPLDLPLSLHVAWTLAHTCARFWRKGLSVGPLSLDSVRIDFDGSLFLPDLGWLPALISLADADPSIRSILRDLPRGPGDGNLADEALRFGTFLYELITFEALPAGRSPASAILQARLWTPEGPQAVPERVLRGLARLLGGDEPYETLEGALKELEAMVFDDEEGPSTFNLAHLMHTLFRKDVEEQRQQLEAELAVLASNETWWAGPAANQDLPVVPSRQKSYRGLVTALGLALAAACAGTFLFMRSQERHRQSLETELARLKTTYEQQVRQGADSAALEQNQQRLKEDLVRLATQAKNAEQRDLVGKELENLKTQTSSIKPRPEPAQAGGPTPSAAASRKDAVIRTASPAATSAQLFTTAGSQAAATAPVQDRDVHVQALHSLTWPQGSPRVAIALRVFVHEDGHALRATPVPGTAAPDRLIKAAMEAAMKSRFLPAIRAGKPVRDWVQVNFNP